MLTVRSKLGASQNFHNTGVFLLYRHTGSDVMLRSATKKLLQWFLYELIENIILFILNTKRPLRDFFLLRYLINNFIIF